LGLEVRGVGSAEESATVEGLGAAVEVGVSVGATGVDDCGLKTKTAVTRDKSANDANTNLKYITHIEVVGLFSNLYNSYSQTLPEAELEIR
jgi:hypothetical protein